MEHVWFEREGVRLHAVAEGREGAPVCLLLHGFPEAWFGWKRQIGPIAEAGFRVVAPDARGYNLSGKPLPVAAYTLDELSDDVAAIADALRADRVSLIGQGWGGATAWYTALHHPERIDRLGVLNMPHPAVLLRNMHRNPRQMLRSWYLRLLRVPAVPEGLFRAFDFHLAASLLVRTSLPGTFTTADLDSYREAWRQSGAAAGMINGFRAFLRYPLFLPHEIIQAPATVLWGACDPFLVTEMAHESLQYCAKARLVLFPDATHWVQHERPEKVNQVLLELLSS